MKEQKKTSKEKFEVVEKSTNTKKKRHKKKAVNPHSEEIPFMGFERMRFMLMTY